jgi:hypothetical protein
MPHDPESGPSTSTNSENGSAPEEATKRIGTRDENITMTNHDVLGRDPVTEREHRTL